jgi:hypothetical protein
MHKELLGETVRVDIKKDSKKRVDKDIIRLKAVP